MGDENTIRTLGDYSKLSHKGYRNTIELPVGNNVVPLRSDTIRLVQNGCSFHGLRSEDPNSNNQASNWLECLPAGSISTWEDLTTRVNLINFFHGKGRDRLKLRNDILMVQQHHGESLSEVWTRFKNLVQKVPHHGIDLWLQVQIFYVHVNPITRRTIDQSTGGKLRDLNPKESWAILEDLALYENKSWNDPRDFVKPVKAIALPQDVPSTSDRRLIELENQVQYLMEAYLALTQPTQVNKITTPCYICNGPHDTRHCMENPEQAFVKYASSRTDEAGEGLVSEFMASQDARLSKFEADFKQQQSEMTNKIDTVLKAITDRITGTLPSDTIKNLKLGTHPVLSAHSYPTMDPQCSTQVHSSINTITIHPKQPEKSQVNEPNMELEDKSLKNDKSNPQP
ncbi:MAK10-like protein [Tanacetum coccineum]